MLESRLQKLRERLATRELDYLLITEPNNRRYLSGFPERDLSVSSSAGWLMIGQRTAHFITSFLYLDSVKANVAENGGAFEVVSAYPSFATGAGEILAKLRTDGQPNGGGTTVGFESGWTTVAGYEALVGRIDESVQLVPTSGIVEELRIVKDDSEIEALRQAALLTDRAYENVLNLIREGITERQVAWEIERYIREHGGEGVSFEPAVAFGQNSAVPHHAPTDRPLRRGEPVWIDCGALLDGYCGDLTRSFSLGEADDRFLSIYELVLASQEKSKAGVKASITGQVADALARDHLAAAGYGEAFGHSLGHGVGLAIHENPRLSRFSDDTLQPGMVTSVEPGVYLSDWGGVRIEDVVVITASGLVTLTTAPKQAIIV